MTAAAPSAAMATASFEARGNTARARMPIATKNCSGRWSQLQSGQPGW
jgi:hypothetical protein